MQEATKAVDEVVVGFLYVKEGPRGLDGPTIEIRDPAFRLATGEGPEDTICAAVSSGSFRTRLLASGSLLRGVASCRTPILSNWEQQGKGPGLQVSVRLS